MDPRESPRYLGDLETAVRGPVDPRERLAAYQEQGAALAAVIHTFGTAGWSFVDMALREQLDTQERAIGAVKDLRELGRVQGSRGAYLWLLGMPDRAAKELRHAQQQIQLLSAQLGSELDTEGVE